MCRWGLPHRLQVAGSHIVSFLPGGCHYHASKAALYAAQMPPLATAAPAPAQPWLHPLVQFLHISALGSHSVVFDLGLTTIHTSQALPIAGLMGAGCLHQSSLTQTHKRSNCAICSALHSSSSRHLTADARASAGSFRSSHVLQVLEIPQHAKLPQPGVGLHLFNKIVRGIHGVLAVPGAPAARRLSTARRVNSEAHTPATAAPSAELEAGVTLAMDSYRPAPLRPAMSSTLALLRAINVAPSGSAATVQRDYVSQHEDADKT